MDSQSYMHAEPATEISLTGILWELLDQWKAVLLVGLLFAVAVPAVKLWRDTGKYQASLASYEQQTEQQELSSGEVVEQALASLTAEDRPAVELLAQQQQVVDAEAQYLRDSILMNLDPTGARLLSLTHLVGAQDNVAFARVTDAYSMYLRKEDFLRGLGQLIDPNADPSYIDELITTAYSNVASTSVQATPATTGDAAAGGNGSYHRSPFTVRIWLPEGVDATAVGDYIESYIAESTEDITAQAGAHDIDPTDRVEQHVFNDTARSRKSVLLTDVNNLRTVMKTNSAALNTDQKAAYASIQSYLKTKAEEAATELVGEGATEDANTNATTNANDGTQAMVTETPKAPSFSRKFALVGFALGIVIYAVAYVVLVVLRGRLGSADALGDCTGTRVLGNVRYAERHTGLSVLFHSKFVSKRRLKDAGDVDAQMERVTSTVESMCEHAKADSVYVLSLEGVSGTDGNLAVLLVSMLGERGIMAQLVEAHANMDEAALLPVSNAVLWASNEVKSTDAWNTSMLCRTYDITPLGSVFVCGW